MITPLVQRQLLQTVTVEAVRASAEGQAQVQQEQARKQGFDAKLAEALTDVADVEEADVLRLSEREGRGRQPKQGQGHAGEGEAPTSEQGQDSAEGAVSHLDLLA